MSERQARLIEVRGVVQGVGFRPFVWRLAHLHDLAGWVRNRSGVVEIHAEGAPPALEAFAAAIAEQAPPMARVEEVRWTQIDLDDLTAFDVDASQDGPAGDRLVPPDSATCEACLRELFDPADRRYLYPFINCTDCGPRFTIIESLPYDRDRTSMREFPMCGDCRREYEDPADRRFHAEPVACPACGPQLRLLGATGEPAEADDPVALVAGLLEEGAIIALKGLGGFHLACDATNELTVARLRRRKHRPDKPFAVMTRDLQATRRWFDPTFPEAEALASWMRPIVLVSDRRPLARGVAPGHHRQGAMLPSTPLHHLLLRATDLPLVMTSGNASDEPICITDEEATSRLRGIADAFLVHDRRIVSRYDDSVVLVRGGVPTVLRRARSFAPAPLRLPVDVEPILGTGAQLHGAFCLASGRRAFLSQHIGDLDTDESMRSYREAFDRFREVLRIEPESVAHDLHPDFLTTRFAEDLGLPHIGVQHHHAHVVSTMAEHGLQGEVLGLAFDGMGLGDDGTIWGGEILVCDAADYRRVGHLRKVRQPGGDAATREPWRMAFSHAADAGMLDEAVELIDDPAIDVICGQIRTGLASPWTSSAGRLFDAIAAIAGLCDRATYEGHPAQLLEQAADVGGIAAAPGEGTEIDARPMVAAAIRARLAGADASRIAAEFHASFAAAIASAASAAAAEAGLNRVVLGGGVFANDLLTRDLTAQLTGAGLKVFLPREAPVGDGGIALGQVLIAHARGA